MRQPLIIYLRLPATTPRVGLFNPISALHGRDTAEPASGGGVTSAASRRGKGPPARGRYVAAKPTVADRPALAVYTSWRP